MITGRGLHVGGGGSNLTITVTVETGSTVTATKGTKSVSGTSVAGVCVLRVPEAGEWTVTVTKGSDTATQNITVASDYAVILTYKPVASLAPKSGGTYTDGIADIAPDKISLYAAAISNNAEITNTTSVVYIDDGALHYKISVGDTITLTVSGASYAFIVMGFNHDDLVTATAYGAATATGKAGMTLQMQNCLTTKYQMNSSDTNANGWNGCAFRTTLQGTIKNSMDSAWQSVIKTVKKLASAGSQSATITTSNDTLFLLSEIEIFGSVTRSKSGEGSQYAWYKAGNTKVKSVSGSANGWWERSPGGSNSTSFCYVNSGGGDVNASGASSIYGVAFAFCI